MDKRGPKTVPIVGMHNVTGVSLNGCHCDALLDTGSMVSTLCESFYRSMVPMPELLDFAQLDIKSACDSSVPYSGFAMVELSVPGVEVDSITVPVLITRDTKYSESVPLILGMNVISHFKSVGCDSFLSSEWQMAFGSVAVANSVNVRSFSRRPVIIKPFETKTVSGIVRKPGEMSVGVTEGNNPNQELNICPRVVAVRSGDGFSKIPVRVCNLSASPVVIRPRSFLCSLQHVDVVRNIDPFSDGGQQTGSKCKSLEELGVQIPSDTLSQDQQSKVTDFLEGWKHIFSSGPTDLGCTNLVEHEIELTEQKPFKEPYRRIPPGMVEEVREHLKDMIDAGAIRESKSPFSSNVVLVRKKDGSLRFCIDFRKLNSRTVRDAYSLPRIEETIDNLSGSRYFSKLDLRSGYWQVAMSEVDKPKTAFSVGPLGFFECNRMAFGLTNAPATFQRLMERTMGELNLRECLIYLDDVIIFSRSVEEHLDRLNKVFERLEKAGLKLKGSKCEFFRTSTTYLGHVVSERGVEADPAKISTIKTWPVPSSVKELRSFLGFAGYYRRFIEGFAKIAKPLNDLLVGHPTNKKSSKASTPWAWGSQQQEAFSTLIEKLSNPPVLGYADFSKPFLLNTDASSAGLGAVLYQLQEGEERVIAYASRGLRAAERNYPAHKLEFLSLKWAVVDKFKDYLYGNKFQVRTDNNPLTYVLTTAKLDATSHRWLASLSGFDFSLKYRSGKTNTDADALSRLPVRADKSDTVLFPGDVKAITQASLVSSERVPAAEAISLSQCVVDFDSGDGIPQDSKFSSVDWKMEQAKDPVLARVIDVLKSSRIVTRSVLAKESESVRSWLRERKVLFLSDGVLYRRGKVSGHIVEQLAVPEVLRDVILTGLHDDAGHQGRDRTLSLVKSRFFWPGVDGDVSLRVRECSRCICRKSPDSVAARMVPIQSSYPLELLCIDFLTLDRCKGGFEHVLIITDHFTRFAQAVPTKNETARTTAKALFERFVVHYGFPSRLHSDQGRNFESSVIAELCSIANVEKSRTTPYHPQCNGMAERFNQTLMNMIGTLEEHQKADWKAHIPSLVHAYNCTRHESTGLTPYYLMFGRHPRLAVDAFLGVDPGPVKPSARSYVTDLKERLAFAYKTAEKESRRQSRRHKTRYDRRVRDVKVEVGDRVLVKNVGLRGRHKLADRWDKEVYIVVSQPEPSIPVFRVKKEHGRGPVRTLHRNLLLPCVGLPRVAPPDDIPVPVSSSVSSPSSPVVDSVPKYSTEKYVIPARRLNPSASEFIPGRPVRQRKRPAWMDSSEWKT